MRMLSRLSTWWRAVTRGAEVNAQVDEELRFHIESYAEDLMRLGFSREEATRRARAELGSLAAARENARQAWGTRWVDELHGDLRYSMRMLAKSPGFAAIAIGSLALGIGANTVIFTAAQHMLLDRLAVPHPEQLRLFTYSEPQDGVVHEMWGYFDDAPGGGQVSTSFSFPVYEQMRRRNSFLAEIFAFKNFGRMTATIDGEAEPVNAEMVSGNYYAALEVKPQLGRGIQDSDDGAVGSGPVVTISDRFWTRRYGRSSSVLGRTILINATPMTIVGVNPPSFTGAYSAQDSPDIFLPFSMQPIAAPQNMDPSGPVSLLGNKDFWWVLVMGRMKPGVPDATAAAALTVTFNAAVHATMTVKNDNQIPRLILANGSRGQNPYADDMSKPVLVLLGLAGFVLLLACANLANLLLARAGARRREMSVRLALGASRGRILRQMLTESLLLSLMGGATGLLLAFAVRNGIPRLLSDSWSPPAFSAKFSWPIFAFAAVISILTGLTFGLAPALQSTRAQVGSGLKDSGQTVTHRRRGLAGKSIVVVQVALSLLLVVVAGLFAQTLMRLGRSPLGFRSHNLLLFGVQLPETRYPGTKGLPALHQIEAKLAAVPGVQDVTLTRVPLLSGNASNSYFLLEGQQNKGGNQPTAMVNDVGADFFQVYGIPIVAGRSLNAGDTATSRKVAVVNQSLVKQFFPNQNPVGRTFTTGGNPAVPIQIVGVCGDARYYTLRNDPPATYYTPYLQRTGGLSDATFAVATDVTTQAILPSLRDAAGSVDRNLPITDVRTQDEQIAATLQQERIFASLTAGFGVLALVLACIGIYGIMAYSVSQRTNEIGIRMALGAPPGRVLRMVLGEASWMAVLGVAAGVAAALALSRLIASMLYGLKSYDPLTFTASAALLLLVGLAASWLPARRAAHVDPMCALRHE
jgi:predicted permease